MADRQLVTRRARPAGISQPFSVTTLRRSVGAIELHASAWDCPPGQPTVQAPHTPGPPAPPGSRVQGRSAAGPREAAAARRVALVRAQPMSRSVPSSHVRLHQRYRLLVNERRGHRRRRCASKFGGTPRFGRPHLSPLQDASSRLCSPSLMRSLGERGCRCRYRLVGDPRRVVFASPSFTSKLWTSHAVGLGQSMARNDRTKGN